MQSDGHDEFKEWLRERKKMAAGTINSRVSNVKRVETYKGRLEDYAERPGELLNQFAYSQVDEQKRILPKHRIPIRGNQYNGTATLKAAIRLYFEFLADKKSPPSVEPSPKPPHPHKKPPGGAWPLWAQPSEDEALMLAHIVAKHVRFLSSEIVEAIVEDNERKRSTWTDALRCRSIDPSCYLWQRCSCSFPGVRRYAGSQEIAWYRKRLADDGYRPSQALRLDDNDYPKQIWSFVFLGKKFPKHGPSGYSLAHLADHKDHGNRFDADFEVLKEGRAALYGLYTCVSNSVYVPSSMIKPTDFGPRLRNLLMRRAEYLYGEHCSLLPGWLRIRSESPVNWELDRFEWAEPVGDVSNVDAFLAYRNEEMEKLLAASSANRATA